MWPTEHATLSELERARVVEAAEPALRALLARDKIVATDVWEELVGVHVPLASFIAARHARRGGPLVVGIVGTQGSGKSTTTRWLACLLRAGFGLHAVPYALDDFYLTAAERAQLARDQHPLLGTRGVPGTHDVALGMRCLHALRGARAGERVEMPVFQKAFDDRAHDTQSVVGPVDVVLFEGWCVGATPETDAALQQPVNALERERDADGRLRRFANAQLRGSYARWFAELDALVMLRAPSFERVQTWRFEQEQKLAAIEPGAPALMTEDQVRDFIAHYERLTRHILRELPTLADVVLDLAPNRRIERVSVKGP